MTSDPGPPDEAYVWIWLPGKPRPVVAGRLFAAGDTLRFNYGKSYLERPDAIPVHEPELPLRPGELPLLRGLTMPGCIRDASPDAWGRRVIAHRTLGRKGGQAAAAQLDELACLMQSGSDRAGALDFQSSPTEYVPRDLSDATLDELLEAAERIEKGLPLSPGLDLALHHGSSIGGARPKALIADKKYIAKFSSGSDLHSVVKAEYIAMRLAHFAGLDVAPVRLENVAGKDVLLVERFDREQSPDGWTRRAMVSALTLLELDEMMARYASYEDFAEIVRLRFAEPGDALRELFGRLVFNILCGNTDDHARNHAAFWDGETLSLTPAYDICPQGRTESEATQAMAIIDGNRMSQIPLCIKAAHLFQLSKDAAADIVACQTSVIRAHWDEVCSEAMLSETDKALLWGRQFLNEFAFQS